MLEDVMVAQARNPLVAGKIVTLLVADVLDSEAFEQVGTAFVFANGH